MSINPIQFQPGLSMADSIRQYGTAAKCYRALYKARWPQGFRCPCCQNRSRSRFRREGRVYFPSAIPYHDLPSSSHAVAAHVSRGDGRLTK